MQPSTHCHHQWEHGGSEQFAGCDANHAQPLAEDQRLQQLVTGKWKGYIIEHLITGILPILHCSTSTVLVLVLVTGELILKIYYRHIRDKLGNYITVNVQHITGILNTGTLHSGKSKIL